MIGYFDGSAFLKLVIEEPGSSAAREAWHDSDPKLSSRLLYTEARAGLARAHRMRRIDRRRLATARAEVHALIDETDLLDVTEEVTRRAGDLAERHSLRAYDAVHLASVEVVADEETLLVAADGNLIRAARARGIATAAL